MIDGWGKVKVKRIEERIGDGHTSSTVWPEFDDSWSELMQLRWHAAVAMLDSGTDVQIHVTSGISKTNGISRDEFCVTVGGTGFSSAPFRSCWTLINGIGAGLSAGYRRYFPPQWAWSWDRRHLDVETSTPIYDGVQEYQTTQQMPLFEALSAKYDFSLEA